jgi:hypothetical protein
MKSIVCQNVQDYTKWITKYNVCCNCLSSVCNCNKGHHKFFHNNIQKQLELIFLDSYEDMCSYKEFMKYNENGDVLCKKAIDSNSEAFKLHILVSTDGGCPYKSKNLSFWPVFGIILDLPLHKRCIHENILFLSLWKGGKPKWNLYLKDFLLENSQPFKIDLSTTSIEVQLVFTLGVFDLPAAASVLNIKQYNGQFGCPYCEHPGVQVKSGRGYCQTYPHDQDYSLKTITLL